MKAKDVWERWEDSMLAKGYNFETAFWSLLDMFDEDKDLDREGEALMAECRKKLLDWIDKKNLVDAFDVSLETDCGADDDAPGNPARKPRKYRSIDDQ